MTQTEPTSVSGDDAQLYVDGVPIAFADVKFNFKQDVITQARCGKRFDRKQMGKKDFDFSLTNIDFNPDHLGKLFTGTVTRATKTVLQACDVSGDWTPTTITVDTETLIKKEGVASLKLINAGAAGNAAITLSSKDLSGHHIITFWVYSTITGAVLKIGIGESAATEQEKTITVLYANQWQRVYWDISAIADSVKNGVTKLQLSALGTNACSIYVDSINSYKGMKVGAGVKFDIGCEVIDSTDATKFTIILAKNCFFTSGGLDIKAHANITGPVNGTIGDGDEDLIFVPS